MKRINNLHSKICTANNIQLADIKARKGKGNRYGILKHDKLREYDNFCLLYDLNNTKYHTSEYTTYKIYEPKERIIYRLPYFPDRICHHAIMNVMESVWTNIFTNDTYSCIKDRGIHKIVVTLLKYLKEDPKGTTYCLKMDIKKFYPSIKHPILKKIIRRKIKDKKLLVILDEIIDSTDGVPIGNYLSLFFANLYLTYFDHWLKEEVRVKYYIRYADDLVILSDDKKFLHNLLIAIKFYMKLNLLLELKPNYLIFPVESRGIDFVGYVFYHTHIKVRKSIKKKIFRLINLYKYGKVSKDSLLASLRSYGGWLKWCNSKMLLKHILRETGIYLSNWRGKEANISKFYKKSIYITHVVGYNKYFRINFIYKGKAFSCKSKSKKLFFSLQDLYFNRGFPLNVIIK